MRENVLWEELHRHREEASEKVSGMREKCFKKDIQDPAAPRAARVLLRRTEPGDAGRPETLQSVQRDDAKFATLQKIMALAETIVCLQDTVGMDKLVYYPILLLLCLSFSECKTSFKLLYSLTVCLSVCLFKSFWVFKEPSVRLWIPCTAVAVLRSHPLLSLPSQPSDLKAVTLPRLKAVIYLLSNHS